MTFLRHNLSTDHLNKTYDDDYYDYLGSEEFQVFLKPIGDLVNLLGEPVLDVGCGEGWLSPFVDVPYRGIDGSETATARAIEKYGNIHTRIPARTFDNQRLERCPLIDRGCHYGTVVFGGIMSVLVLPEQRVPLMMEYQEAFDTSHFIIYDLYNLDCTEIEKEFGLPKKCIVGDAKWNDAWPKRVRTKRMIRLFECR